jgi:hypothetical protein
MVDIDQLSPQNQGIIMGELDKHRDDLVVRSQRDAKAAKDLEQIDAQIANWKATAASSALQAQAAWKNANTGEADMLLRRRASDEDRLSKLTQQKLALTTTIASAEGSKMVMDEIAKIVPEGRDRMMMLESFGKMATDPKFKDLTPAAALQAVAASVDSGRGFRKFFWNGTGDDLTSNMEAALTTPDSLKYIAGRDSAVKNYDQQIEVLRRSLYPELYKNQPATPTPAPGATPGNTPAAGGSTPTAAAANPSLPPPTTMTPKLQAEQALQQQEIANRTRKTFTPEVQAAMDADKAQLTKFQGQLDKRRVDLSKALGIEVPPKPGTTEVSPWLAMGGPEAVVAQAEQEQKRYQAWLKTIDRRIQMQDAGQN